MDDFPHKDGAAFAPKTAPWGQRLGRNRIIFYTGHRRLRRCSRSSLRTTDVAYDKNRPARTKCDAVPRDKFVLAPQQLAVHQGPVTASRVPQDGLALWLDHDLGMDPGDGRGVLSGELDIALLPAADPCAATRGDEPLVPIDRTEKDLRLLACLGRSGLLGGRLGGFGCRIHAGRRRVRLDDGIPLRHRPGQPARGRHVNLEARPGRTKTNDAPGSNGLLLTRGQTRQVEKSAIRAAGILEKPSAALEKQPGMKSGYDFTPLFGTDDLQTWVAAHPDLGGLELSHLSGVEIGEAQEWHDIESTERPKPTEAPAGWGWPGGSRIVLTCRLRHKWTIHRTGYLSPHIRPRIRRL
jgi:hypothetical protein